MCRAARAGLVECFANSFSKDDVPGAADSNTAGLPLAEKAVEPRDERMTGSSHVSSLCCKVGFRVTLFPALDQQQAHPELPLDGQKPIFRRWSSRHPPPSSKPLNGPSSVHSDGWRRWHWNIASAGGIQLLARHPIARGGFFCQQCGRSAMLLPCCSLLWWGNGKLSAAILPSCIAIHDQR